MRRLVDSVKGDYRHVPSRVRPEDIEGKFFIAVAKEHLRLELAKRKKLSDDA